MYIQSIFVLASFASLVLSYAVQQPVAHARIVRRCDNETHPLFWPFDNETSTYPPSGSALPDPTNAGLSSGGLATGYSFPHPCGGYGGFPCYATGTGGPGAETTGTFNVSWTPPFSNASSNTTSRSDVGPDMISTASLPSNQSGIATATETAMSSQSTLSLNSTGNTSTTDTATTSSNSSGQSTTQYNSTSPEQASSYLSMTTLPINGNASVFSNQSFTSFPSQPSAGPCWNSIGSACSPFNGTYVPTGPTAGGGVPRWGNDSTYSTQGISSTSGTASLQESVLVATLTVGITPSPEVVTLTATVDVGGVQASSKPWENATESSNYTETQTASPFTSDIITMTIVVASNSTDILGSQTSPPSSLSSTSTNSSAVAPASTSITTSATGSANASFAFGNSTSALSTLSSNTTTTAASGAPLISPTASTQNSTLPLQNNTSAVSAATSLPYWGNATSSPPCAGETSNSRPPWSDWSPNDTPFAGLDNSSSSAPQSASSQPSTGASVTTIPFENTTAFSTGGQSPSLSLTVNNTSTSMFSNSTAEAPSATLPANATSATAAFSPILSSVSGFTEPNLNASTICMVNSTVAFCPSTAAPWLSTAPTAGTASATGGTTLMTSFVLPSRGDNSGFGKPQAPDRRLLKARLTKFGDEAVEHLADDNMGFSWLRAHLLRIY
ncbi:hypothetical protein HRR83_001208 [Exophiala dermatitidis]|uniref:Ig-like domain-containing protein n=1 Tax=Exophiala dermatitidis TaxID=5970 RepID=A0AAN6EZB5_EXODE|nr:hypothetical protein HRR74_001212 [Exophiala dermatitidis]KAJ4527035.1 hypothetical protein HRR73_001832 [Exophiala dermatitidis]KAJ4532752.1 hypothetical protein HRR76_007733 [Exophiala dermatitidis]KAJ4546736.1 hypothetical protein HRR77_004280 [Exophiala dermatitidis]KAJ4573896.1 hypothetical protein HRR79_002905 [Exophiala dermatitidis]